MRLILSIILNADLSSWSSWARKITGPFSWGAAFWECWTDSWSCQNLGPRRLNLDIARQSKIKNKYLMWRTWHVIRSIFTDRTSKSVVPCLKSVQRPNCPATALRAPSGSGRLGDTVITESGFQKRKGSQSTGFQKSMQRDPHTVTSHFIHQIVLKWFTCSWQPSEQ